MGRIRMLPVLAVAALALAAVGCSSDDSSSGSTTTAKSGGGVTVPTDKGTQVDVTVSDTKGTDGPMTMVVSTATAPAGKVTFTMKNTGTIEHEMIVIKTDTPYDQLKVNADDKVSEDGSIGEISETPAGETKSVTLDMPAGKYALVCNIAKHYAMNMRAPFTTT